MNAAQIATEKYEKLGLPPIPMPVPLQQQLLNGRIFKYKIPRCPGCGQMNLDTNELLITAHHEIDCLAVAKVSLIAKLNSIPRWIRWAFNAI